MATNNGTLRHTVTLAEAMSRRMAQLGISKRELASRTGLSRQTINNVENGRESIGRTLAALDNGLYWKPGTALALSEGNDSMLEEADLLIKEDDGSITRWRLVMRVASLSLNDLDKLTIYLDRLPQGKNGNH
jgi:transcriptional regulator with XRE-family HTH domain